MCPDCGSPLEYDFVPNIADKDINQFIERCTGCNYRISIIEFEEDFYEDDL